MLFAPEKLVQRNEILVPPSLKLLKGRIPHHLIHTINCGSDSLCIAIGTSSPVSQALLLDHGQFD